MKTYLKLAIPFVVAFGMSLVAQFTPPEVFGDWKCQGRHLTMTSKELRTKEGVEYTYYSQGHDYTGCDYNISPFDSTRTHEAKYHWGFRRYLFIAFGIYMSAFTLGYVYQKLD